MSKRSKYEKKSFESTGVSGDTSANVYMSMLLSEAWMDLTALQQRLYLYCKAQYYGEKQKPTDDKLCFTMNRAKWSDKYRLYGKSSNQRGFYRDMSALIEHGFIVCQASGATTRKKSIYRFSDKWQQWDPLKFQVPTVSMNVSLMSKEAKRKNAIHGKV